MRLLEELAIINGELQQIDQSFQLLEDLGKLKELGLGRLVNAFKQSFTMYSGRRSVTRPATSGIGNKINRQVTGVGNNSEAIDLGVIKNWNDVKKAYKNNDGGAAIVFYINNKASVLMVSNGWNVVDKYSGLGLAWDFKGTSLKDEEINDLASTLNTQELKGEKVAGKDDDDGKIPAFLRKEPNPNKKSERSMKTQNNDYDWNEKKYKTKDVITHYQGITQTPKDIAAFITKLASYVGATLTGKLILTDKEARAKRGNRNSNPVIEPKDIKLFKDQLSTRLAKYKLSKYDEVEDVAAFVKKVFEGGANKLTLAGTTYSAVPDAKYLGSNSKHRGEDRKAFHDTTMRDLFSGKSIEMQFDSKTPGKYGALYLTIKFVKGSIEPVEASYYDENQKRQNIKF